MLEKYNFLALWNIYCNELRINDGGMTFYFLQNTLLLNCAIGRATVSSLGRGSLATGWIISHLTWIRSSWISPHIVKYFIIIIIHHYYHRVGIDYRCLHRKSINSSFPHNRSTTTGSGRTWTELESLMRLWDHISHLMWSSELLRKKCKKHLH